MKARCLCLPAIAIGGALIAVNAYATDDTSKPGQHPQARKLDAVMVTGTVLGDSSEIAAGHYAGSRQVIGHDQLAYGANRSLDDALQYVPGVKILDETGSGVLPQIMLRGLYESRSGRVQVLFDGIPLSLAPYGQTSLSLFPVTMNQIDRIDIVRGGAAVQYGPNNVGGVINLVSKRIPENWTTTIGEKITAGGAGHYLRDTSLSTGGYLSPTFGMQLDADWIKGQHWRDHSATDVKNVRLRTEWWLASDKLLKAELQRYVASVELAGALSTADYRDKPRQSSRPMDVFGGRSTRSALTYQQDIGDWGPFDQSQFSWSNFGSESERNFVVGARRLSSEFWRPELPPQLRQSAPRSFSVYGTEPRLNLRIDGDAVSQHITVGARAVRENISYLVGRTDLDDSVYSLVRDWVFSDRAWAGYASDAFGVFDDRLVITPGLRYEHLDSTYRDRASGLVTRNNIRNWLPGLTIGYTVDPAWYVYADAQRSLRAPQVTAIVLGDNLDSELAWNYEAGLRYTPGQNLGWKFDLYRIDFDNQILFDNSSTRWRNIGKTRHQGAELSLDWQPSALPGVKLSAGYAYLDARQRSSLFGSSNAVIAARGNEVPYTSRNQFSLGAMYFAGHGIWALSGYYYSGAYTDAANTRQEDANAAIGRTPSYAVWNAQWTQTLLAHGSHVLKSTLAINNLFDRQYWYRGIDTSPWGRQPAPGRTASAGLELTF
ncbi:TonB-dependent receptor family protein [Rhodanobacter sp. Col0626]|uniref:TonB-dependent receptor family protein n=1 Tax=Rhodanobacter sp. Col0626 TaxID=3415679 RepID=UPI003CE6D6BC